MLQNQTNYSIVETEELYRQFVKIFLGASKDSNGGNIKRIHRINETISIKCIYIKSMYRMLRNKGVKYYFFTEKNIRDRRVYFAPSVI